MRMFLQLLRDIEVYFGDYKLIIKFILNAKNLSPNLSVFEAGITINAYIFVVYPK